MANRIDIELTSAREGGYTWRAAGARQPRGVVDASLLPPGSKVGDVLRAEVEVEMEGITVVSIIPTKEKSPAKGRIEFIGPSRAAPGVTTALSGRPEGGPRRGGGQEKGLAGSERRGAPSRQGRERPGRPQAEKRARRAASDRQPSRREGTAPGPERPSRPSPRRQPRFEPGRAHRDELLTSLSPEQRPIAERLATGGLPAVRRALADEQSRARAEGRPVLSGEPIIAMAEQLLPEVKAAVWLDTAEAAVKRTDEMTLRELRAAVVGAAPRDESGRELARQLREALDARVTKLRREWEERIERAIEEGRVLHALRLSARPPEPTARFPASLVQQLTEQAGQAMADETPPSRWLSLLEAAGQSPVRRQIRPAGMPKDPSGEVERQARLAAGRIPALARLLGMPIPPPPRAVPASRGRPARDKAPDQAAAAPSEDPMGLEEGEQPIDER